MVIRCTKRAARRLRILLGVVVRSSRRKPRRRSLTLLKALPLILVVIAAGTALRPVFPRVWHSIHPGQAKAPALTVDYRTGTTARSTAVAAPQLVVVNTSKRRIPLSDVTVRYYFSADTSASYGFNCVQAGVSCSRITGAVMPVSDPTPTADHYLEIGFATGSGALAPGQDSKGVEIQLYRLDHKRLNQSNDRSFDASIRTYKPSSLVTAYLRGVPAWGNEPSGGTATTRARTARGTTSGAGRPAPTVPSGTAFDDFHYSGPHDPALLAHGWQARSGAGGPGIDGTWSAAGVSFPAVASAKGGQALQLRVGTDGTRAGTRQAELQSTGAGFFTGTYAARIYFSDAPARGSNGDHINESFYPISADDKSPRYSELDNEYMPNGGWGAPGPALDTTSWYSPTADDRVTHRLNHSLQGWHTLMITAVHGVATYSLDGRKLFSSDGKYFPREEMGIHFNAWFIDLPFTGSRTWDMRVNWFYYKAGKAVSLKDVQKTVAGFYRNGTHYVDTMRTP
jgi:hypothetical protein